MSTASPSPWTPPTPEEVTAFLPSYDVEALAGTGGMAAVYRARHRVMERSVAIKIIPAPAGGAGDDLAESIAVEAKALAALRHPGIVEVHDTGRARDWCYLVLEWVDGIDLAQYLAKGRTFNPTDVVMIGRQVCAALGEAHGRGVLHLDIKPDNLFLNKDGLVKLGDFGVAQVRGGATSSGGASLGYGSPGYTAPERHDPNARVDGRADVFSLGVTLQALLTGNYSAGPEDHSRWPEKGLVAPPGTPPQLAHVIAASTARNPARRFADPAQMRRALRAATQQIEAPPARVHPQPPPAAAPPPPAPASLPQTARAGKGNWLWVLLGMAAVFSGGAVVVAIMRDNGREPAQETAGAEKLAPIGSDDEFWDSLSDRTDEDSDRSESDPATRSIRFGEIGEWLAFRVPPGTEDGAWSDPTTAVGIGAPRRRASFEIADPTSTFAVRLNVRTNRSLLIHLKSPSKTTTLKWYCGHSVYPAGHAVRGQQDIVKTPSGAPLTLHAGKDGQVFLLCHDGRARVWVGDSAGKTFEHSASLPTAIHLESFSPHELPGNLPCRFWSAHAARIDPALAETALEGSGDGGRPDWLPSAPRTETRDIVQDAIARCGELALSGNWDEVKNLANQTVNEHELHKSNPFHQQLFAISNACGALSAWRSDSATELKENRWVMASADTSVAHVLLPVLCDRTRAIALAESCGGILATPSDSEGLTKLISALPDPVYVSGLIGGYKPRAWTSATRDRSAAWRWVTGDPVDRDTWAKALAIPAVEGFVLGGTFDFRDKGKGVQMTWEPLAAGPGEQAFPCIELSTRSALPELLSPTAVARPENGAPLEALRGQLAARWREIDSETSDELDDLLAKYRSALERIPAVAREKEQQIVAAELQADGDLALKSPPPPEGGGPLQKLRQTLASQLAALEEGRTNRRATLLSDGLRQLGLRQLELVDQGELKSAAKAKSLRERISKDPQAFAHWIGLDP